MNIEERAIRLLISQYSLFGTALDQKYGKDSAQYEELTEIVHTASRSGLSMQTSSPAMFLVAFESHPALGVNILQNYLSRAIKGFDVVDPRKTGWFEGTYKPSFSIKPIIVDQEAHTIRQTVKAIQDIREFVRRNYNHID